MVTTTAEEEIPARRRARAAYGRFARRLTRMMPKGLFVRSLIIIIAPVVLLQALIAFVFMERHFETVTARLAAAVVGDIAALVDIMKTYPQYNGSADLIRIARERLNLNVAIIDPPLPAPAPKPFFSQLDGTISAAITKQIGKPFWIDTVARSNLVEIRILLDSGKVLKVFARRSATYASNSLIFISWMVGTSLVLLAIAIVFLRNQIRPILRLAAAVDEFGKGRSVPDFTPRGAREVRRATLAFHDMKGRVERQIEQRTAMLAGVSHDLRTVLTRFQLQLALIEDSTDVQALRRDIDDMNRMLEGYLAFARGDDGEAAAATDIGKLLREVGDDARISGHAPSISFKGDPLVIVRPQALKRCFANLVFNACRHGKTVTVAGRHEEGYLTVVIDDDGPGVPPEEFEAVFRPFYRLDAARNLDESGTGLGLSIARDIARGHGGEIQLAKSPLGGLRATVTLPA